MPRGQILSEPSPSLWHIIRTGGGAGAGMTVMLAGCPVLCVFGGRVPVLCHLLLAILYHQDAVPANSHSQQILVFIYSRGIRRNLCLQVNVTVHPLTAQVGLMLGQRRACWPASVQQCLLSRGHYSMTLIRPATADTCSFSCNAAWLL